MVENFSQALKAIGDGENWAGSIEMDMLATVLEYLYNGQLQLFTSLYRGLSFNPGNQNCLDSFCHSVLPDEHNRMANSLLASPS